MHNKHDFERSSLPALTIDLAAIPHSMRTLPQWCTWRLETRPGDDHRTKIPKQFFFGSAKWHLANASSKHPGTWSAFEHACHTFTTLNAPGGLKHPLDGIGFVLAESDPFCVIDLDDAVDLEATGAAGGAIVLRPFAAEILAQFPTFAEVSPSGTGVKLYFRATKPGPRCKRKEFPGIEIFDRLRFVALTGRRLPGTPEDLTDCQAATDELYARMFPVEVEPERRQRDSNAIGSSPKITLPHTLSDTELLAKIDRSKNGQKLMALLDGSYDGYPSRSEADFAAAAMLAFWCGGDRSRVESIMRLSGLCRPEWDKPRGEETWIEMTIRRALANKSVFYGDGAGSGSDWYAAELADLGPLDSLQIDFAASAARVPIKCGRCKEVIAAPGDQCECNRWQAGAASRAAERRQRTAKRLASERNKQIAAQVADLAESFGAQNDPTRCEAAITEVIDASLPTTYTRPAWGKTFACSVLIPQQKFHMEGSRVVLERTSRIIGTRCGSYGCFECKLQNRIDQISRSDFRIGGSEFESFLCGVIPVQAWVKFYAALVKFRNDNDELIELRCEHRLAVKRFREEHGENKEEALKELRRVHREEVKALRKKHGITGNYFRFHLTRGDEGDFYQIVTDAIGATGLEQLGLAPKNKQEAMDFARAAINAIDAATPGVDPVANSEGWGWVVPEIEPRWKTLGRLPDGNTFASAIAILEDAGITGHKFVKVRTPGKGEQNLLTRSLQYSLPMGVDCAEYARKVYAALLLDMWTGGVDFFASELSDQDFSDIAQPLGNWLKPDLAYA